MDELAILKILFQESKRFQNGTWLLLCWCFTTLRHFSCRFRRGQLTYPHCSWVFWASLIDSFIPVLLANNCPAWISGRERMTVEIISWPISTKECCQLWRSNRLPGGRTSDRATAPGRNVVDFYVNKEGKRLCDLLVDTDCCILNGRNSINND